MRHNQIRNITAKFLKDICSDFYVEPELRQLSGDQFEARTINKYDDARLNISVREVFRHFCQKAFFVVSLFNPMVMRYKNMGLSKCYRVNENKK